MGKSNITPEKLYTIWSLIAVFCLVVVPVILGLTSSGGEQKPLIWLANVVPYVLGGYFILSIITALFFRLWFKKYWYVNVAILAISIWAFLLLLESS